MKVFVLLVNDNGGLLADQGAVEGVYMSATRAHEKGEFSGAEDFMVVECELT